jgi:SET family sugar efflux transporter-like MFS transporter
MQPTIARARQMLRQPDFAGLLGCAFVLGVGHSFVAPFLSLWGTKEIGLSPEMFGLYMTAASLSSIVVATTLARWSDSHLARRTVLLIGGSGGALAYATYAWVRDPWVLSAVACTVLALQGVCFSQLFAHTRERFPAGEVGGMPAGFLTSVVRMGFSLAWTAGPSVGAWVMVQYGFRGLFLGAAALFALFVAGVLRFVPHEPRTAQAKAAVREPVWRVLARGDILAVFVAFLCIFAAHTINLLNLPLAITQQLGGTERHVGIAFGLGPLAELPLMLWFGLLAARGHQLGLIRFGAAATVVYFLLLPVAREPWHVFPLQILHGLSFAVISNVAIVFFQDLLPGRAGLATAIFSSSASLGNLVGYLGFGALVQPVGNRGMFFVSAGLTALTLALMLRYRRRE